MFIRFRQMTADRYRDGYGDGKRACVGKCRERPRYYPRYGIGFVVKGRTFLKGCPMKPLCPLLEKRHRLEVSIVETHREGGKVRQKHVASLGSFTGDRDVFWRECELRLARLSNQIGPNLDRLREAIAARIPPLTDADREAMDAEAWQRLEAGWNDHAKLKADEAATWNAVVEQAKCEAIKAEAMAQVVKHSHGNQQVFDTLNMLLGRVLAASLTDSTVDWEAELAELRGLLMKDRQRKVNAIEQEQQSASNNTAGRRGDHRRQMGRGTKNARRPAQPRQADRQP